MCSHCSKCFKKEMKRQKNLKKRFSALSVQNLQGDEMLIFIIVVTTHTYTHTIFAKALCVKFKQAL